MGDGYLANGSASWQIPNTKKLASMDIQYNLTYEHTKFKPYKRYTKTLARPWAIPVDKNLEHRIGGLEKTETGDVSCDGENHYKMCKLRLQKIKNIANEIPFPDFYGKKSGHLLLLSWGSSFGSVRQSAYNL